MTNYKQTIGKRQHQTGLLPALPALGSIGSYVVSGIGIGAIAGKAGRALGLLGKGGKAAAKSGLLGTAAKTLGGFWLFDKATDFMSSGPSIGGVNIIPMAVIGVGGVIASQILL